jgi:Tol biopolymer transport system component
MIGKKLAHYQIVDKLGEGGMGVVWKARDTHLDRFVALKTLQGNDLGDAVGMRRFVQEAKAASALNHPNIVHIYDTAEADGIQFIAMEYVSGKTLNQLILRKGLPPKETLKYAMQIADALARAHAIGIVHRDLKPSNVMVDDHGLVKVLDFGLAKLTGQMSGDYGATSTAPLQHGPNTAEGTIVGTVAYMSPEQAEGKPLDARSDIFSFGSVLYEMITGRRAFHGDSKLSTLSAILRDDPAPMSGVVADVPRELERIIARCLRKEPDRRFQHMDDISVALAEVLEEIQSGTSTYGSSVKSPSARQRLYQAAGGVFVLLLLVAGAVWFRARSVPAGPPPKVTPVTSFPGREFDPALSPDGNQVAFSWTGEAGDNWDIYLKLVGTNSLLRLTKDPSPDYNPTWSPDGRYLAFVRSGREGPAIFMVSAIGGEERKLASQGAGSLSWTADGRFLAMVGSDAGPSAIYLLSVESGARRRLTSPSSNLQGDMYPAVAPDGGSVAFARFSSLFAGDIYVLSLGADGAPKGNPKQLTFDERRIGGITWTPDGRSIIFSSNRAGQGLWRISASGGTTERIAAAGDNATYPSISKRGDRLAFTRSWTDANIWRTPGPASPENRGNPAKKFIASTREDTDPRFSPDGTRIAFASDRSGSMEIWLCDRDGRNPQQLTSFGGPDIGSPRWSPDGRRIAFDAIDPVGKNLRHVYTMSIDGEKSRRLTTGSSNEVRPSWSGDGQWIYFGSDRSGMWQVWKARADGGAILQVTKQGGREAFESPDGRRVYYHKRPAPGIWKVPIEGGDEVQILDKAREGDWALWGGGVCFFLWKPGVGPTIQFLEPKTHRSRQIAELPNDFQMDESNYAPIAVSPDGKWLLYVRQDLESDVMLMEGFR